MYENHRIMLQLIIVNLLNLALAASSSGSVGKRHANVRISVSMQHGVRNSPLPNILHLRREIQTERESAIFSLSPSWDNSFRKV